MAQVGCLIRKDGYGDGEYRRMQPLSSPIQCPQWEPEGSTDEEGLLGIPAVYGCGRMGITT
jgi:hypothetical protein